MLRFDEISQRRKFRLWVRAICLSLGLLGAFVASLWQDDHIGWSVVALSGVIVLGLIEFIVADILTDNLYPASTQRLLDDLEKNLGPCHEHIKESLTIAIKSLRACDVDRVSGAFHLVVDLYEHDGIKSKKALLQVTDYSGPLGGKRWRFTSSGKGIVGRCLRSMSSEFVNFASKEEYDYRMVREFGFFKDELASHSRSARSYWAEPVKHRDELIGVIYLFSTEPQVFPLAVDRGALQAASAAIVAYLRGANVLRTD